ncbi:pyridoxal phosphate-dependent decarboxylase family protein [Shewanella surugensis]|uniref:Aspartate aminotransferase family protein n=1 Tax=Shewanella surugensis TaxID=212020 RepID=A0ABT0LCI3_9GAMM|nr:aspartate aminotransferase family protein [Shewanella surugensis]MCL1125417.1 aspartate aminotransferase family protein [Shewanella surugensis]
MMSNTETSAAFNVQSAVINHEDNRQYIFNSDNLAEYEQGILQGLAVIKKQLTHLDAPFTGILPHELIPKFEHINLDSPFENIPDALKELENVYLKDAVYFNHPKYIAHLNCPVVYPAILAELIISSINSSLDTWDQSAGGTLIEQTLLDWTAKRIGFGANGDGIFTSGGTQSNLMAMLLARDAFCMVREPGYEIKERGLPCDANKFRIFTSESSHFSVQKSAAILGLGYDAVISVPVDHKFKMDTVVLDRRIIDTLKQGLIPIAVVATTGTTDFGSIDPINQIADLCEKYGLWMHADAAYGCGLLVTENYGHLLNGIERADSVTVDFHKSFFQPVSCGAFFVKDKSNLSVVTHHAEYLNPLSQQLEGTPNLVNKSIQTTRRFDSLKLWLTMRIMGPNKIGAIFEQVMDLAQQAYVLYQADKNIEVIHKPEISTLVFRFVPENDVSAEQIDKANEHIRKAIFRSGEAVVASTQVKGRRYLKFTLLNPSTEFSDLEDVLNLIKEHGRHFFNLQLQA